MWTSRKKTHARSRTDNWTSVLSVGSTRRNWNWVALDAVSEVSVQIDAVDANSERYRHLCHACDCCRAAVAARETLEAEAQAPSHRAPCTPDCAQAKKEPEDKKPDEQRRVVGLTGRLSTFAQRAVGYLPYADKPLRKAATRTRTPTDDLFAPALPYTSRW